MTLSTKLNQAVAPMTAAPLIVADRPTYITHLIVANPGATDETIQFWVGASAVDATCILPPVTIVAGGWLEGGGLFLSSGESLYVEASADGLTVTAFGMDGATKDDAAPPSAFGFRVYDASGRTTIVQVSTVGALDDVADVTLAAEADDDLLVYDTDGWVNASIASLGIVRYVGLAADTAEPPTIEDLEAELGEADTVAPAVGLAVGLDTGKVYLAVTVGTAWHIVELAAALPEAPQGG